MGRSAREFYKSTLLEIHNAIEGFEQLKREEFQEYMFGVRKICYWQMKSMIGKKMKKEEDIFSLDIDKEIRKAKVRKMKPIEKTRYNGK